MSRRGVGLIEAIIAGTLASMLLALALSTLLGLQRAVQRDQEHAAAAGTLLTVTHLLRTELGDVDPAAGDLLLFDASRLLYRGYRGTATVCAPSTDGVVVRADTWRALRQPSAGRDSVALLPPDDTGEWIHAAVAGSFRPGVCPDGVAGLELPLSAPAGITPGAALRLYEIMELRQYTSGGEWWLGLRSVSGGETIQPVAGPFQSGGLLLDRVVQGGVETIRARLAVRAGLAQAAGGAARSGAPVGDSLGIVIGPLGGWP